MSLVIARKLNDHIIHIVSDTKVTDKNSVRRGKVLQGALKAIVLSPYRCLCYAGNVGRALLSIQEIYSKKLHEKETDEILAYLSKVRRVGNNDIDFLFCEHLREESKIYILKENNITESNVGWIGDQLGFNAYQKLYHERSLNLLSNDEKNRLDEFNLTASRMDISFLFLTLDVSINGIGDHCIIVATSEKGFRYRKHFIGFIPAIPEDKEYIHNDETQGGYSESILVPKEAGIGAIGVHVYPGKLGVLYYPKIDIAPKIYRNVNTPEFFERLRNDTQVEFTGIDNNPIKFSRKTGTAKLTGKIK